MGGPPENRDRPESKIDLPILGRTSRDLDYWTWDLDSGLSIAQRSFHLQESVLTKSSKFEDCGKVPDSDNLSVCLSFRITPDDTPH